MRIKCDADVIRPAEAGIGKKPVPAPKPTRLQASRLKTDKDLRLRAKGSKLIRATTLSGAIDPMAPTVDLASSTVASTSGSRSESRSESRLLERTVEPNVRRCDADGGSDAHGAIACMDFQRVMKDKLGIRVVFSTPSGIKYTLFVEMNENGNQVVAKVLPKVGAANVANDQLNPPMNVEGKTKKRYFVEILVPVKSLSFFFFLLFSFYKNRGISIFARFEKIAIIPNNVFGARWHKF